ncbi:MAG: cation-transporting P-type ATPase, partial [Planctomycetota bacterium]
MVREALLDSFPLVNAIPFAPEYQYSATYHDLGGQTLQLVKGAPERVLAMCARAAGGEVWDRASLEESARQLAEQGYRVLALAQRILPHSISSQQAPPPPEDLEFLGFVAMIDPLRSGAKEAIRACRRAGVLVTMVARRDPACF